ncbi:MAG: NAD(P)H-dependent oxidoreductase subunit E [Armatimonadetes bacterium]|nr:NAD(P)H-dependent oxidoreductase subunit E [Armatimonadota bacterium]
MAENTCECEKRVQEAQAEEAECYRKLDEIIEKYKGERGVLIQVLHQAQEIFGWLPERVQIRIADGLGIPLSEVHGVVTFYSFFNTVPRGEHVIRVCMGTACYVRGGKQILEKLQKELDISTGGTTADRKFSLEINRCVGACGLAPVLTVGTDIYRRVKLDKVPEIIARYKGNSR